MCVCPCIHVSVYTCVCLCECVCLHVYMCLSMSMYLCLCVCACVCVYMCLCVYLHVCTRVCAYVCMCLLVGTCLCVTMHVCACLCWCTHVWSSVPRYRQPRFLEAKFAGPPVIPLSSLLMSDFCSPVGLRMIFKSFMPVTTLSLVSSPHVLLPVLKDNRRRKLLFLPSLNPSLSELQ